NNSYPFTESFESISIPGNDWFVLNDYGNPWQQTLLAAHTGVNSMRIYNFPYAGNPSTIGNDDLISTSFDLSNVSNTMMTFWRAFAYRSSTATDGLKIYASTSCGQLWSLRYAKSGTALATAGLVTTNFVPTASQWAMDVVNLSTPLVSGHPNVRFKFEYVEDSGNNIYLDDINLDGTVGINEIAAESVKFEVYPNPAHAKAHISFTLSEKNYVQLKIVDVTGREVRNLTGGNLDAGEYQFDIDGNVDNGVYNAVLSIGNNSTVKKLVLY
ncbi:MAG: T9SS type A sorting domain-containing protein, partial [Bacteroidota bacterium]